MNLELIKSEAERKKIPFKRIASGIGMSEGNLHRCVRENRIQAGDLEKVANILKVDISIFFDGTKHKNIGNQTDHSGASIYGNVKITHNDQTGCPTISPDAEKIKLLEEQIAMLKSNLADKDEIIALYKERK